VDRKRLVCFAVLTIVLAAVASCARFSGDKAARSSLKGLRTVTYGVPDLERAKAWYTEALGIEPYFDEPFYVGFNVGGYELGLDPKGSVAQPAGAGVMVYWGVDDIQKEHDRLLSIGAKPKAPVQDVGGDIKVTSVLDPFGNPIGLIYNPHFDLDD
jgi:catechol 2,3-dioxygenase-like lactoylglutathione lyase family enzyme